jgi:hypothetical protein
LAPSNRKRKKGLKKAEPSAGAAARRIYAFTAFRIVTDTGGVIHLDIKKWIACSRSFAPTMAAALGHRAELTAVTRAATRFQEVAASLLPASG